MLGKHVNVRKIAHIAVWAAWGAALVASVPAAYVWRDAAYGNGFGLPAGLYLYTPAYGFAVLAAAASYAARERLRGRKRRAVAVAAGLGAVFVAALAASVVLEVRSGGCPGPLWEAFRLVNDAVRWLRYLALMAWAAVCPLLLGGAWTSEDSKVGEHADGAQKDAVRTPLQALEEEAGLSERERSVVEGLLCGKTLACLSHELGISASTVATYRNRACEKLGLSSVDELRAQAGATAAGEGRAGAEDPAWRLDVDSPAAAPLLVVTFLVSALFWRAWGDGFAFVVGLLVLALCALGSVIGIRAMRLVPTMPVVPSRRMAALLVGVFFASSAFASPSLVLAAPNHLSDWAGIAFAIAFAALLFGGCAWLVGALTQSAASAPCEDVPADAGERCVLYLRGRGLGELEARAVALVAQGRGAQGICEELHIARGTLNSYRAHAYASLGVHSRADLAALLCRDVGGLGGTDVSTPLADQNKPSTEDAKTSET